MNYRMEIGKTGEIAKDEFLISNIVHMAKRLKLDLKKLGGIDNRVQELWKGPTLAFIITLYEKRFGRRSLRNEYGG
jgi:hypothetical protein